MFVSTFYVVLSGCKHMMPRIIRGAHGSSVLFMLKYK